jgi:putative DNA methylase
MLDPERLKRLVPERALEAVLEVLPVGKAFSGIDLEGDLAAAGNDFEALENLRKLAFTGQVDPP